jgi:hypothetical protein
MTSFVVAREPQLHLPQEYEPEKELLLLLWAAAAATQRAPKNRARQSPMARKTTNRTQSCRKLPAEQTRLENQMPLPDSQPKQLREKTLAEQSSLYLARTLSLLLLAACDWDRLGLDAAVDSQREP